MKKEWNPTKWDLSPGRTRKDKKHYETKSTKRGDFKRTCFSSGWKFEDFKEVDSGERSGTNKKFYYFLKDGIINVENKD